MSASDSERTFTASRLAGTKILLFALINGKTEEMIVVTPISPAIPRAPKPSKRNNDRGDMDENIPY